MALTQTTVSGNDLGIVIAGKVMKNLFAGNITPVGYVVNADYQGFSTETFTVGITRIARPGGVARTISASGENGGFFNTSAVKTPTNSTVALFMDRLYDQIYDIAYTLEDSVPYGYIDNLAENISAEVGEQITKDTLLEMYNAVNASDTHVIKHGDTGLTDIYKCLIKANTILSNGDIASGDRTFPSTGRALVASPQVFEDLLTSEKYILTGSDKAFQALESGYQGVNYQTFKGVIAGLSAFECPDSLMPTSTAGKVEAFVDHVSAVTRAYYDKGIRAIACPQGQGTRLQPYYRWGVKAIRPAGIVAVVSKDWSQS